MGLSSADGFDFAIEHRDGATRAGRLLTPHGAVPTPTFMPVATYGAVRGVGAGDLERIGARMVLANTFHLHERPGEEVVAGQGGLHGFTGWRGPWLTDSGGFQVTSLAHRAAIDDDGITFSSPLDGRRRRLTPERAVAIQEALGADIAMVLDECLPTDSGRSPADLAKAMARTLRWAERARAARTRRDQALFGIVQGGTDPALRRTSAEATAAIGFDGYAHGGLGLGEERAERADLVTAAHEKLPEARPRYLMGLGRPRDLLDGVAGGVDLFDCVVPSRNGRHGLLFTRRGVVRIKNARYRDDGGPIDPESDCPLSGGVSRAYLRHLFQSGEALGPRLATLHNLRFYLRLLEDARSAVAEGGFAAFRAALEPHLEADAD